MKPYYNKIAAVLFCVAMVALLVFAAIHEAGLPSDPQLANRGCRYHQGVRSINEGDGFAVCRDGWAVDF